MDKRPIALDEGFRRQCRLGSILPVIQRTTYLFQIFFLDSVVVSEEEAGRFSSSPPSSVRSMSQSQSQKEDISTS